MIKDGTHPSTRSFPHVQVSFSAGDHDCARAALLKGLPESVTKYPPKELLYVNVVPWSVVTTVPSPPNTTVGELGEAGDDGEAGEGLEALLAACLGLSFLEPK